MHKLALSFKGKIIREFSSYCQLFVYISDILSRIALILLFTSIPILYEFLSIRDEELSMFIGMYIASVIIWGFILIKFIISRKEVFGKSKFDIYYMGLLAVALISVLLSSNRVTGVFGSTGTWSFSVITYLAVAVIYYVSSTVFKYSRGVKWLAVCLLGSILVPSIYHLIIVLQGNTNRNFDYFKYAVMSIPLTIGIIFTFKKLWLRVITFIALIGNLFLVAYYSRFLSGTMFILNLGVLSLFILFYFSFWIKNRKVLIDFISGVLRNFKNIKVLRDELSKRKRELVIFAMMIFMALWIIGFSIYVVSYFQTNIGDFIFSWMKTDIGKVNSLRMWIIGENDLSKIFSSFEFINILSNYGIWGVILIFLLLINAIYLSAKQTLELLYVGNFRNIILLSSIFVTFVMILLNFFLSRFNALTYMTLILVTTLLSVIDVILKKEKMYSLIKCKEFKKSSDKILRIIISLLIIVFMAAGVVGILTGLDRGIF